MFYADNPYGAFTHANTGDNNGYSFTAPTTGHLGWWNLPLGKDWSISTDITIDETSNGYYQAGITVGHPKTHNGAGDWLTVRFKKNGHKKEGEVVGISDDFQYLTITKPWQAKRSFSTTVTMRNGLIDVVVDGEKIIENFDPSHLIVVDDHLTIGLGAYGDDNVTTVSYNNIVISIPELSR
jgi:hypothetical protein